MLWVKSFHLIFLVSWYAGLFYLPRLYVHHAMAEDRATRERLREKKCKKIEKKIKDN